MKIHSLENTGSISVDGVDILSINPNGTIQLGTQTVYTAASYDEATATGGTITNQTIGNQIINGDLIVTGSLTAQQFIVSSSVTYLTTSFASGSTKFGDTLDDVHGFTGSLSISGSLIINGTSYSAATSGTSGANGSSGATGSSGSAGTSGTSGADGSSGATGSSGSAGTSGTSGTATTSTRVEENFIATANQTTFTVTGGYTAGLVDVFVNGVRFLPTEYTATNGTTVVFNTGLMVDDEVTVLNYTSVIAALPTSRNVQDFTATAGQTTFTVTNGYIVGLLDVFVNGSKLTSSEFTATNGTTFVLTVASTLGDQVQSINYTASVNGVSGVGTTNQLAYYTASSTLSSLTTVTYPSLTELSYVKGVTSSLQTQLNAKAATLSGTTNNIPKFTSSSAIGDSAITDNGTTVTLVSRALSGTSATFSSTITSQANGSTFGTASTSGRAIIIQAGSTNQAIMFKNAAGGDGTLFATGTSTTMNYSFNTYSTADALFIANGGNVGIGTISPVAPLDIKKAHAASYGTLTDLINLNGYFPGYDVDSQRAGIAGGVPPLSYGNTSFGWISFRTKGSDGYLDRMIIHPNNLVVINGTNAQERFRLQNTDSTSYTSFTEQEIRMWRPNDSGAYFSIATQALSGTWTGGGGAIDFRPLNTLRMTISAAGNIGAPSGTNIYNASDIRLKQNVSTTTYGLDAISALNPVIYNWINGFEPSEDGKDLLGFVAQEVLEVIPEAVESFGGDINLNGTVIENPLRVNEKFIIPVLVKAIQELSAKVTLLENAQ